MCPVLIRQSVAFFFIFYKTGSMSNCLYRFNGTSDSRIQGHEIRIVSYALIGLVTVDSIKVNYVVSIC
jgi:hypothetical protein